jgi:hypothetical protein
MRNTFSWPCVSCGEYNVAELKEKSPAVIRCSFCFHPLQAFPSLESRPRVRLSDDWLGDERIRPLFGQATVRNEESQ